MPSKSEVFFEECIIGAGFIIEIPLLSVFLLLVAWGLGIVATSSEGNYLPSF